MQTFDPHKHFGFLSTRVSRLMMKRLGPKLRNSGYQFPTSCIGALADLRYKDGVTQKELGISLIKNKSSINKIIEELEKASLVKRLENPEDRRNKKIFLTQEGEQFCSKIKAYSSGIETKLKKHHSEDEIENAKNVLNTLYEMLSRQENETILPKID